MFLSKYGALQNRPHLATQNMQANLDLMDFQSPVSQLPSQKSALSKKDYEYQLSQYRMLEMQSNMLYSTKEDPTSANGNMGKAFNRTIELKSLVTPDVLSPDEPAKSRKKEVRLPRRRSPERAEPDPKDLGIA